MYIDGLGFKLLGEFNNHGGFDGKIIGHDRHPYHLEFTHHTGAVVGNAPTQDNLLVFYVPDAVEWLMCCNNLVSANFRKVTPYNAYWANKGVTFEDVDGYRVVVQNSNWTL